LNSRPLPYQGWARSSDGRSSLDFARRIKAPKDAWSRPEAAPGAQITSEAGEKRGKQVCRLSTRAVACSAVPGGWALPNLVSLAAVQGYEPGTRLRIPQLRTNRRVDAIDVTGHSDENRIQIICVGVLSLRGCATHTAIPTAAAHHERGHPATSDWLVGGLRHPLLRLDSAYLIQVQPIFEPVTADVGRK
jgi:hypothetical protein